MSTLLKPLLVRDELLRRGIRVFTPQVFSRIFESNPHVTKYFLETQTQEGLLLRLKKGVYALKTDPPSEEEIANALYRPSYISFEYALAYYQILPEMTYTVTSATTKPTRLFKTGATAYSYRTIKDPAYTGYSLVKKKDRSFLIAEAEKALVDYLYFVSLHKAPLNDRLSLRLNKGKLKGYIQLFESRQLEKLAKQFL